MTATSPLARGPTPTEPAGNAGRWLARPLAVGWWSLALRRMPRRAVAHWRRSIQLRVVTTTLLLTLSVTVVVGSFLVGRVRAGLLEAKVTTALAESQAGASEAQDAFDNADRTDRAGLAQLLEDVVRRLATGSGPAGDNQVVLLRSSADPPGGAPLAYFSSFDLGASTIPPALRATVARTSRSAWTYLSLPHSGQHGPAVAVGSRVSVPDAGGYELYFLFPLDKEQQTLRLVQRTMLGGGLLLVLLVGAVAWLVTRQVVTPVRMAARISERLAAGGLEERMRVRGEDDLARLAASFNKMAASLQAQIRQLEDLSRVQRRFVSDVSHELRTPLTTVRMAADVLHESRQSFDPSVSRSAELLQTQLDRFEALLADLLEISRYDAGAAVLEAEPVDLRRLTEAVIEAAEPLAERRGSRVNLAVPDRPCVAEVDSRRVERILRNLVVNAIEHGEGRPISVRVACDADAVAIVVRDRGVGLRPGESALVFNRFWRADPARARGTGGSGLGLSIALEDAHLHGGWLQAWGEPGAGSQFRLTLPKRSGEELLAAPLALEPHDSTDRSRPLANGSPYRRTGPPRPPASRGVGAHG